MDNPETKSSAELRIIKEIQDLGLSDYVAELMKEALPLFLQR